MGLRCAMPRDPYIREKFTKDRNAARKHAAEYFARFPKHHYQTEIESWREHEAVEWQAAMEALILVATSGGPTMFARIGIMRALNRDHVREFDTSHKDKHWGRRKLARDQ
jgi:hypothetical protein